MTLPNRELIFGVAPFGTADPDRPTERSMPSTPSRVSPRRRPWRARNLHRSARGQVRFPNRINLGVVRVPQARRVALQDTLTGLALAVDVFGSAFFLLARYEEIAPARGRSCRLRGFRLAGGRRLHGTATRGRIRRTPVGRHAAPVADARTVSWPFRLRLTHDVDQPVAALGLHPVALGRGLTAISSVDTTQALPCVGPDWDGLPGQGVWDDDPLDTFDLLMDTSERWAPPAPSTSRWCRPWR